jgi:hypothetical protein
MQLCAINFVEHDDQPETCDPMEQQQESKEVIEEVWDEFQVLILKQTQNPA